MASKKAGKVKQIKDEDDAAKMLLDYLNKQNRPYNANDIGANLHDAIGKTVITRVLASMAERGELNERAFGKQKIYFAKQANLEKLSREELDAMDNTIEKLREDVSATEAECSTLQTTLNEMTSLPKTEEAEVILKSLKASNAAKEVKLKNLRENSNQVSVAEKNAINNALAKTTKEWRRRRRMAMDILSSILESSGKDKATLYEEMGIETDEACGVDLKDF